MGDRLRIVFVSDSRYPGEYVSGDSGYVDGYCRGGDDIPYAVVAKDNGQFVMVELNHIRLLQ